MWISELECLWHSEGGGTLHYVAQQQNASVPANVANKEVELKDDLPMNYMLRGWYEQDLKWRETLVYCVLGLRECLAVVRVDSARALQKSQKYRFGKREAAGLMQ